MLSCSQISIMSYCFSACKSIYLRRIRKTKMPCYNFNVIEWTHYPYLYVRVRMVVCLLRFYASATHPIRFKLCTDVVQDLEKDISYTPKQCEGPESLLLYILLLFISNISVLLLSQSLPYICVCNV